MEWKAFKMEKLISLSLVEGSCLSVTGKQLYLLHEPSRVLWKTKYQKKNPKNNQIKKQAGMHVLQLFVLILI